MRRLSLAAVSCRCLLLVIAARAHRPGAASRADLAARRRIASGACQRMQVAPSAFAAPLPPTKTIVCGFPPRSTTASGIRGAGRCSGARTVRAGATLVQQNNAWVLLSTFCPADAPNAPPRVPTAQDLRRAGLATTSAGADRVGVGHPRTGERRDDRLGRDRAQPGPGHGHRGRAPGGAADRVRPRELGLRRRCYRFHDRPGHAVQPQPAMRHGAVPGLLRPHLPRRRAGHDHAVGRLACAVQPGRRRHLDRCRSGCADRSTARHDLTVVQARGILVQNP